MKSKELGILLDKHPYSESSSILNFFTLEKGYVSFLFKGGRKKGKAINLLGLYEISHFKRPESDLGIIQSIDFAWTPSNLYSIPQKVLLVFFMADILKQTLRQQGSDSNIFEFIRQQLIQLELEETYFLFPTQFLSKYMGLLGYAPLFEDESASFFNLEKGIFTQDSSGQMVIQEPETLNFLKELFLNRQTSTFSKESVRKGLDALLVYAQLHLPHFSVKDTMEVLHDTIYD